MNAFTTALTALAALPVAGVQRSYALGAGPERPAHPTLPALLIAAGDAGADALGGRGLFAGRADGLAAPTLSGGPREAGVRVRHLLIVGYETAGRPRERALARTAALIDAYLAAMAAAPTLGGALAGPAEVAVMPGLIVYHGVRWHGCTFLHTWRLAVPA